MPWRRRLAVTRVVSVESVIVNDDAFTLLESRSILIYKVMNLYKYHSIILLESDCYVIPNSTVIPVSLVS